MNRDRKLARVGAAKSGLTAVVVLGAAASLIGAYGLSQGWTTGGGVQVSQGAAKALSAIASACEDGNTTACQEMQAASVASQGDINEAVRMIEAASAQDPVYAAQCHQVAHYIGRLVYYQLGVSQALATMPGICRGGVLHGAQEEWSDDKSLEEIVNEAPDLCQDLVPLGSGAADTCHHGIGHVLEYEHGQWQPAAQTCVETLGNAGGGACLAGAVMSWVDKNNWDGTLGTPEQQATLLNDCLAFTGPGFYACGQSAGYAMMHAANWDAKAAGNGCALAREEKLAGECAVGLGLEVGYLAAGAPLESVESCNSLDQDNLHDPCLAGAALRVIQNVMDVDLATRICESQGGIGPFCQRILDDAAQISGSMAQLEERGRASGALKD